MKPYTPNQTLKANERRAEQAQPPMKTMPGTGAEYVRSWGGKEGIR